VAASEASLIEEAGKARHGAIATYSGFSVGAALESRDGAVCSGCNIESASYGLTMCAERVALCKALSEGARDFVRMAIVSSGREPAPPCGACRQLLWEYCGDIEIISANLEGAILRARLGRLFPQPFDASIL